MEGALPRLAHSCPVFTAPSPRWRQSAGTNVPGYEFARSMTDEPGYEELFPSDELRPALLGPDEEDPAVAVPRALEAAPQAGG